MPIDHLDTMLTCKQLTAKLGISRSTLYRLLLKGLFPKPVRIGPRGRRWPESAIREWLAELKASDEKEYGSESTDLEADGVPPLARPSIGHLVGGNFQRQVRLGGRGSLDRMIAARIGAELTRRRECTLTRTHRSPYGPRARVPTIVARCLRTRPTTFRIVEQSQGRDQREGWLLEKGMWPSRIAVPEVVMPSLKLLVCS